MKYEKSGVGGGSGAVEWWGSGRSWFLVLGSSFSCWERVSEVGWGGMMEWRAFLVLRSSFSRWGRVSEGHLNFEF